MTYPKTYLCTPWATKLANVVSAEKVRANTHVEHAMRVLTRALSDEPRNFNGIPLVEEVADLPYIDENEAVETPTTTATNILCHLIDSVQKNGSLLGVGIKNIWNLRHSADDTMPQTDPLVESLAPLLNMPDDQVASILCCEIVRSYCISNARAPTQRVHITDTVLSRISQFKKLLRMRIDIYNEWQRVRRECSRVVQSLSMSEECKDACKSISDAKHLAQVEHPMTGVSSAFKTRNGSSFDDVQRSRSPFNDTLDMDAIFSSTDSLYDAVTQQYGTQYLFEQLCSPYGSGMMGRERHKLSKRAEMHLIQHYDIVGPYPTLSERIHLAQSTGLTKKQVLYWFGNRRMREKNGRLGAKPRGEPKISARATAPH